MMKKLTFLANRRAYRLVAAMLAVLFILICAPQCVAEKPTATAVITDQANLPASPRFGVPEQFKLTGTGDVFFTSGGNSGLFRWSQSAGIKRLLQTNDPIQILGIPGVTAYAPDGLLDVTGALLEANAGRAAFVVSAAIKGDQDPGAPIVYDGSSYRDLNLSVSTFSQLLLNASGSVAVLGRRGYWSTIDPQVLEVSTASGDVIVAEQFMAAPASVGGTYHILQLIGFNDSGQVAFLADIQDGNTNRALFLFDGTDVHLVAKSGNAPGNFSLPTGAYYTLNESGQVAFFSNSVGGQPAIWIGDASGVSTKLVGVGGATGITGWGNYNAPLWLRGFNDSGEVLYDCNTSGGPSHALFLKSLADSAPQVVFSRGQSGGSAGTFDTTQQASLNNDGNVAFLATLTNGTSPIGWYLGSGTTTPIKIAAQGDTTPISGKYGLQGRNTPAALNSSNQVLFLADVLESNAVALFRWTSPGGISSVVSTNDSLPAGAKTVLRAETTATSDTETLVRIFKAGGQSAWYAKQLNPGMSGLRKIVAEFDQVPDAGTVVGPGGFLMNRKGEVVFMAALLGSDFYPRSGILGSRPASGLEKAVLVGDSAPDGGSFIRFSGLEFNNQTQVAFFANTTTDRGIFIASPEPPYLQEVVHRGDVWPDGGTFIGLDYHLSLNDSGQVAFHATRSAPFGGQALFVGTAAGTPLKVAEAGDSAPVGNFNSFDVRFKLNSAGKVAFVAYYPSGSGVFLGTTSGAPETIATSGSAAPGAGGGTFASFSSKTIDLNSSGQVAFWSFLDSSEIRNGWFLGSATAPLEPRLLPNQALPGGGQVADVPLGSRFAALADSGEMAIYVGQVACCEAEEPQVVIAGANGTLRKFAISGDKANGTSSDFAKLYPTLVATPSGSFLFGAMLTGGPAKAGIFIDKP